VSTTVPKPRSRFRTVLLLVGALAVVGVGAFAVSQRWATIRNAFDSDREDSTQLAGLATAELRTPTAATVGGWPQWLGPNRDGVALGPPA